MVAFVKITIIKSPVPSDKSTDAPVIEDWMLQVEKEHVTEAEPLLDTVNAFPERSSVP